MCQGATTKTTYSVKIVPNVPIDIKAQRKYPKVLILIHSLIILEMKKIRHYQNKQLQT